MGYGMGEGRKSAKTPGRESNGDALTDTSFPPVLVHTEHGDVASV
jgi:hypothetical protein